MMLDGAEECQLSGPVGELVPYSPKKSGTSDMSGVSGW
jgi:hypothetical protein